MTECNHSDHVCPRPVRFEVLTRAKFFAALDPDDVARLDDRMQVRSYEAGDAVYGAGQDATRLFVLAAGRLKLMRPSVNGQDTLLDVITPGGLFGTLGELGDPTYRDSAIALTDVCALSLEADAFHEVLREHPPVALAVLQDMADRLARSQEVVRGLAADTVEQRVAATLLSLAAKVGQERGGVTLLELPLSRADLAAMTGATTESVSRVMSKLRRDGLVETGRQWTKILNSAGLTRISGAQE